MKALLAFCAMLLPLCAAAAAADSCPAAAAPFQGFSLHTQARELERFMMVSAYHLEPYSEAYLDNVLGDLGRHHIAGVVYGTLGAISAFLRAHGSSQDEISLNRRIFAKARQYGAGIWLQLRLYDNQLSVAGATPRNYSAAEILADAGARKAFDESLRSEVQAYNEMFSESCTVVMFEEAGIYHSAQGGGEFWSSEPERKGRPDEQHDRIFAERMSRLFAKASRQIKTLNPRCRVGMHLGHSVFNNAPVLKAAIEGLQQRGSKPDFIYYDFYLKAQPDFDRYAGKLSERANLILKDLQLPAWHLAQLHTMNNFQHGLGGTPSQSELDRMVQLDLQLGFSGIGFYTKNATPTSVFDNGPLAPNTQGQATVYESSKDRWDYGMLKLVELGGADFGSLFDLAVQPGSDVAETVYARNVKTGQWDLLGVVGGAPQGASSPRPLVLLRELDAGAYLFDRHRAELRFSAAGGEGASGAAVWLLPSLPSSAFRGADSLGAELARSGTLSGARAHASQRLAGTDNPLNLCLQ